MKYEVRYDPKAENQLDKLPGDVARRIIRKIREVGETGRGIETLKDEKYGFKVRIGKYRALIDLTYNPEIIWVRYIDIRGRIYKRLFVSLWKVASLIFATSQLSNAAIPAVKSSLILTMKRC